MRDLGEVSTGAAIGHALDPSCLSLCFGLSDVLFTSNYQIPRAVSYPELQMCHFNIVCSVAVFFFSLTSSIK